MKRVIDHVRKARCGPHRSIVQKRNSDDSASAQISEAKCLGTHHFIISCLEYVLTARICEKHELLNTVVELIRHIDISHTVETK